MKKLTIILFLVLAVSLVFAGDSIFEYFNANSDGKVIKIEWKSINEASYQSFELERSSSNEGFKKVYSTDAKGYSSVYYYTDDEAYYKIGNGDVAVQTDITYNYRVKIIKKDQSYFYSTTTTAIHKISSFRRSWGMIKQMFL